MEKKTKSVVINEMLANEVVAKNDEWVAYLTNELSLLEKRSARKRAVSVAKASVDTVIKSAVFKALKDKGNTKSTVTEILSKAVANGDLENGTSNQKVSAILKKMIEDGVVKKTVDKKTSLFALTVAVNPYEDTTEGEDTGTDTEDMDEVDE